MREDLRQGAIVLLSKYLGDIDYWCEVHDADGINSVTACTPPFETLEEANAYRLMVKAVLKEMKDAV